jgi:hypothetical protein
MTSRRAQKRRALESALDALEADSASSAYAGRGLHAVARATKGGFSGDHPSRRQARNLDRQGQGDADPQTRRWRSRPADRPGVRGRPREGNGPIAGSRPGAVGPKADERAPEGSQHRARRSAVTSRRAQRRAMEPTVPEPGRPLERWRPPEALTLPNGRDLEIFAGLERRVVVGAGARARLPTTNPPALPRTDGQVGDTLGTATGRWRPSCSCLEAALQRHRRDELR